VFGGLLSVYLSVTCLGGTACTWHFLLVEFSLGVIFFGRMSRSMVHCPGGSLS